jgi:hypothetical protein
MEAMRVAALLLLAWLLSGPPVMTLQWTERGLVVQRHISGCLSLEGGNMEPRPLPAVPCDASPVFLPSGGVDFASAPQKRAWIVLRTPTGEELGREGIPPRIYALYFPVAAN